MTCVSQSSKNQILILAYKTWKQNEIVPVLNIFEGNRTLKKKHRENVKVIASKDYSPNDDIINHCYEV